MIPKTMTFLVFAAGLAFGLSSAKAADALYRFETTYQSAGTYHGSIFGLSSDVRLSPTLKLLPRAENLTRTFDGGVSFNETTLSLDAAQTLSKHVYVIGGGSATPNAVLNPLWAARVDPHYASGRHDFGLRLAYSEYADEKAATFTPSYLYALNDTWAFSQMIPCARADAWYVSSVSQLLFRPTTRVEIRVVPAFGQTLESAGAPATFNSLAAESSYQWTRRFRVGFGATRYRSTLRREDSFLLRLEAW